jgi:hypothetical protein
MNLSFLVDMLSPVTDSNHLAWRKSMSSLPSLATLRVAQRGRLALAWAVTLSIMASAGCSSQPSASTAPTVNPNEPAVISSPVANPSPSAANGDLTALTAVVNNTRTAVEAGDGTKAEAEFEQFETAWKPVEDGIKDKNPKAYEAIEEAMDSVSEQLGGNLDQAKALAALSSLDGAIAQAK